MKIHPLLPWILLIGCGSKQPPGIPPGTVVTPPDPPRKKGMVRPFTHADAGTPSSAAANPVTASFIDIKEKKSVDHVACETRALILVKGKATAFGENLAAGDILMAQGKGSWDMTGDAVAVSAVLQPTTCDPSTLPAVSRKIVRATKDPSWVFPNGAMKGWLDVESGIASIGRMEGVATVPEHVHENSWEILCAVDAKGTLMLNGAPQTIAPKTCTQVPPNTKHAWTPDAGSKLVAVQLYAPPGPEQRFKAMAADAGAPKPDAGPPAAKADSGAPAPKR